MRGSGAAQDLVCPQLPEPTWLAACLWVETRDVRGVTAPGVRSARKARALLRARGVSASESLILQQPLLVRHGRMPLARLIRRSRRPASRSTSDGYRHRASYSGAPALNSAVVQVTLVWGMSEPAPTRYACTRLLGAPACSIVHWIEHRV